MPVIRKGILRDISPSGEHRPPHRTDGAQPWRFMRARAAVGYLVTPVFWDTHDAFWGQSPHKGPSPFLGVCLPLKWFLHV